ncbi:glycosyltransferase family 2 protein [Candidatus Sumerlaeota bacterium]|nr:glycosyltransferase family 2 protein [Candidatus Sumerlaeota bacterium]
MLSGKKVVVVFPAYNAERTLEKTFREVDRSIVEDTILVDDASKDGTAGLAKKLGIHTVVHSRNKGYGGNQKTCYRKALEHGADIVVMVHPDYQYSPRLIPAMAAMIASGHYDAVMGSRMLGQNARRGGMPTYKYISNRFLTLAQNVMMGQKLSEYHTGYRAFSRRLLEALPLEDYDDDFIFDNQMIAQAMYMGWRVGEISCPTRYFDEASSINFRRSCTYGLGVLRVSFDCWKARKRIAASRLFPARVPPKQRGPGTIE